MSVEGNSLIWDAVAETGLCKDVGKTGPFFPFLNAQKKRKWNIYTFLKTDSKEDHAIQSKALV